MGSRLAAVGRSVLCMSPARSLGLSSSSSFDTEKFGRPPCGSGMGGAMDSRSPAASGSGMSFASRGKRRGMIRRRARASTRAAVSATSASTIGRAVGARPPFEGGRDPILKLVPPIGQARHVARRQLQGQSVHGSDEESRAQQAARDGEPQRAEQLAQHERHEGQDRAREQPAETVELGAPQSDLLSDFRDEPLENDWIGHGHLPVSVRLPQEHLFLRAAHGLHLVDELSDQPIDVHALRLALEVQDEPVAKRGQGDGAQVVDADVEAPFGQCEHLGAEDEGLGPARARAVADESARHFRRALPLGMGGEHDERARSRTCDAMGISRTSSRYPITCGPVMTRWTSTSRTCVVRSMISTSSSSAGYCTRSLKMNRSSCASGRGYVPSISIGFCVASTKKGDGSRLACPDTVTLPSCMPSSSADCVFGVARFTSSASRILPNIGPALELELLPSRRVLDDHVGADDVARHEVGSELDPREGEVEALGERLDEQGLAEARNTLEQDVPAREEPDEDVRDDLVMAHDDLADLRAQGLEGGDELLHSLQLRLSRLGGLDHSRLLSLRAATAA